MIAVGEESLRAGGHIAGATMPGLPFVVLGQNERVAWGFTNTGPDVQDLYIERIKREFGDKRRTPVALARCKAFTGFPWPALRHRLRLRRRAWGG